MNTTKIMKHHTNLSEYPLCFIHAFHNFMFFTLHALLPNFANLTYLDLFDVTGQAKGHEKSF